MELKRVMYRKFYIHIGLAIIKLLKEVELKSRDHSYKDIQQCDSRSHRGSLEGLEKIVYPERNPQGKS